MTPGALIPTTRHDQLDLARIEALATGPELAKLAVASRDPRMSATRWIDTLAIELLSLVMWAARRRIDALDDKAAATAAIPDRALVLLPRYGFAIHVLRRAVPLAACGIPTSISVPAEFLSRARAESIGLIQALGLEALLDFPAEKPASLAESAARHGQPIFLTGRVETYARLRHEHPDAQLIGATGRCAVLLTSRQQTTVELEESLRHARLEQSCSNLSQVVECDWSSEVNEVGRTWPPLEGSAGRSLRDVLRQLHPSVVYCSDRDPAAAAAAQSLAGYTLVTCEPSGSPLNRIGFAADPIAGWPGDYLL